MIQRILDQLALANVLCRSLKHAAIARRAGIHPRTVNKIATRYRKHLEQTELEVESMIAGADPAIAALMATAYSEEDAK